MIWEIFPVKHPPICQHSYFHILRGIFSLRHFAQLRQLHTYWTLNIPLSHDFILTPTDLGQRVDVGLDHGEQPPPLGRGVGEAHGDLVPPQKMILQLSLPRSLEVAHVAREGVGEGLQILHEPHLLLAGLRRRRLQSLHPRQHPDPNWVIGDCLASSDDRDEMIIMRY